MIHKKLVALLDEATAKKKIAFSEALQIIDIFCIGQAYYRKKPQ